MSDAAIEKFYEEQLQAAPRLLLHVDGRLRRVEPNTPEGRVAIDKAALRYSETSENVTVNREVAPVSGSQAGDRRDGNAMLSRPGGTAGESRISPAPLRGTTSCCKPSVYPGPSGIRYRHSFDCPTSKGQVFVTSAAVRDPMNLAGKLQAETLRTGLELASMRRHPVSYVSEGVHGYIHTGEDAYDCIECSERGD